MKKLVLDDKVDVLIGTMSSGGRFGHPAVSFRVSNCFYDNRICSPDLPGNVLKRLYQEQVLLHEHGQCQ